ncbi:MAG: hypothetical protein AB7O24_14080 [Kofleriaceae bacterium]
MAVIVVTALQLATVTGGSDAKTAKPIKAGKSVPGGGHHSPGPLEVLGKEAMKLTSEFAGRITSVVKAGSLLEGIPVVMPHMPVIMAGAKAQSGDGEA